MLAYGTLAAAVLACLWLISFAPLRMNWGRELVGAAIAIVAMAIGLRLSRGQARMLARPPPDPPQAPVAGEPAQDNATPAPADAAGLSVRERHVLRLLAQGLSNKQLAREMSVSENTVKTHLANVYAKLGVSRRTEALAAALRLGLIPQE